VIELASKHNLAVVGRNGRTPVYCFSLPSNITVYDDVGDSDACIRTFSSGQEVYQALQSDSSFSSTYMGLTISGPCSRLLGSSYESDRQYAFINQSQPLYTATFDEGNVLFNDIVKGAATGLPDWDPQEADIVRRYFAYFQSYGTHLVTKVTYGRRYQIMVSASNSNEEQKRKFGANVKAQYLDGPLQNRDVHSESYGHYQSSSQWRINVNGGDKTKAEHWKAYPEDRLRRDTWLESWNFEPNDDITSVKIQETSALFAQSPDPALQTASANLKSALAHLLTSQRSHCWIFVDSDYGWVEIMSRNARIEVPDTLPPRVEPGFMNERYVRFGKPREGGGHGAHGTFRDSMRFTIVGDGGPVDVVLGTGDAGAGGMGTASISLRVCGGGSAEKVGTGCRPVFGLAVSSVVEFAV
jgi:MAC/Perforin domain